MVDNHAAAIAAQRDRVAAIESYLDIEGKRVRLEELRAEASAPGLWDDPEAARQVTTALSRVEHDVERYEQLLARLDDLEALNELAVEMDDEETEAAKAEEERVAAEAAAAGSAAKPASPGLCDMLHDRRANTAFALQPMHCGAHGWPTSV